MLHRFVVAARTRGPIAAVRRSQPPPPRRAADRTAADRGSVRSAAARTASPCTTSAAWPTSNRPSTPTPPGGPSLRAPNVARLIVCDRCHGSIHQRGSTSSSPEDHWRAGCLESGHARFGRGRRKRTSSPAGTLPRGLPHAAGPRRRPGPAGREGHRLARNHRGPGRPRARAHRAPHHPYRPRRRHPVSRCPPGARQVFRLRRDSGGLDGTWTGNEIVFGVTSLPPDLAGPAHLNHYERAHRGIENKIHWVRDVKFHEDNSQVRTGTSPRTPASFRNLAITAIRLAGRANIAHARRDLLNHEDAFAVYDI